MRATEGKGGGVSSYETYTHIRSLFRVRLYDCGLLALPEKLPVKNTQPYYRHPISLLVSEPVEYTMGPSIFLHNSLLEFPRIKNYNVHINAIPLRKRDPVFVHNEPFLNTEGSRLNKASISLSLLPNSCNHLRNSNPKS